MQNKKPRLTPRELEILRHLANGSSDNTIAENMNNCTGSIKNTLSLIRLKLGSFSNKPLNKRTNLAEFYREHLAIKSGSNEK
jgi:DNA-binding NarL/FixJ family response regulator